MNRRILQRAILLVLICTMAISLVACDSGGTAGSSSAKPASAAATPANDTRYVSSFTQVKEADFESLRAEFYMEDGFYAASGKYKGLSGSSFPVFIGYDGSIRQLPGYTTAVPADDGDRKEHFTVTDTIRFIHVMKDGRLLIINSIHEYWNDDPDIPTSDVRFYEDYHTKSTVLVRFLDGEGKELSSFACDLAEEDAIKGVTVTSQEEVLLATESGLRAYSPDGQLLWQTDLKTSPEELVTLKDGRIFFSAYGAIGFGLYPVNTETHQPGDPVKLPSVAYSLYAGDGTHDLYYSSGTNFFAFDIASGESTKVFSWMDLDISGDMFQPVYAAEDGSIYGYVKDDVLSSTDYKIFQVKEVPASSVKEKKTLVLATLGLDSQTRKQVIRFNRNNEEYHITVNDYSRYDEGEGYSASLLRLQTEILAGNSPDIIDLSEVAVDRLAAKGLLEDLYPYLDADPNLKREDFLPNVITAAEYGGKLVSTLSGFSIESLVGASEIVGDTPGWTYDEFTAALARMPDGCTALGPSTTRYNMLEACLTIDLDRYVDWSTGECHFEDKAFTDLLQFAKKFPASYDSSLYEDAPDMYTRLATGMQMLIPFSLDSFTTNMTGIMIFGEHPFTYIGYPTASGGEGSCIRMSGGLAMSAACKQKEGVWQFLRSFFTEEYQRTIDAIPSNKAAFDYQMKAAMTVRYEKNEDGTDKLDENGEKIPQPLVTYSNGAEEFSVYALSQADADNIVSFVESTTKILNIDVSILSIVEEQAEAFFQGQKSAEEVARLVQSKVSIYVNEQR